MRDKMATSSFRNISLCLLVLIQVYCSLCLGFQKTTVIVGENMTFSGCDVRVNSLLTILRFSKRKTMSPSTRIAFKQYNRAFIADKPYKNRVTISPSGFPVLSNISIDEQGFYTCVINHESGGKEERYNFKLEVGAPPVINTFPISKHITKIFEGEPLRIVCNATGLPRPTISWLKNTTMVETERQGILEISKVVSSDSGVYKCTAKNYVAIAEKLLEIEVHPKPKVTDFYTPTLDIKECQNVNLTCEARGNIPKVDMYHFYHNGKLVKHGSSGVFIIIEIRPDDQGIYTCVPENNLGMGLNKSLKLQVEASPDYCQDDESTTVSERLKSKTSSIPPSAGLVGTTPSGYPKYHGNVLVTFLSLLAYLAFDGYLIRIIDVA